MNNGNESSSPQGDAAPIKGAAGARGNSSGRSGGAGCRIERIAMPPPSSFSSSSSSDPGSLLRPDMMPCLLCGAHVVSCCAVCKDLDGAPVALCAIPTVPGALSCFETFHEPVVLDSN